MSEGDLRAGILAIGNEVLDGLVQDTNSIWIEKRLNALGIEMRRLVTVRDEIDEIGLGLKFILEECDVVVTSGGLGPTHDDITLKAIAQALNLELIEDQQALQWIQDRYTTLLQKQIVPTDELTDSRRKMARLPKGSIPLRNEVGTAPGVQLDFNSKTIFCLPGVPGELFDIWDRSIQPWLEKESSESYYQIVVEFDFIDESLFAPIIDKVMSQILGVWIKSMPKRYGTTRVMRVWISSRNIELGESEAKVVN
ncbi:MAG: competence/damage-inducible protein A, partial [Candidatus Thorarchaeota archaeon]